MARFGAGLATDADLRHAAELATRQALQPLAGQRPDLVCAFACGLDPDEVGYVGRHVAELSGARTLLGCSAGGVIGAGRGVEAVSAVSVWAAVLPGVTLRSFHLEVLRTGDGLAVVGLPERTGQDQVVLLLADPYSFPADSFVERANDSLAGLPLVGGLAAGPRGAGSTRLFLDGRAVERGAVGVVLGGPVGAVPLVSQGCRPIGPTMVVTAAEGNVLLELAGVAALTKLQQVVAELPPGDQALATTGLQLGVAMDEYAEEHDRGDFLIRGLVGADRDRGALVVGDLLTVGQTVRFQLRDADTADEDLTELLAACRTAAAGGLPGPFEGALLFSCNGRGAGLFASADHDVLAVRRELGIDGVGGFFAAGEIGPVGGRNHLHGFTASILAFGPGGEVRPPAPRAG
ncbi:MAG: FIST C-terminal domain-containing protein [Actinomycetota bacterium]|nr:FIST C-terminal domain-containing protein [Actinomycetota bacterium]